jgi:hypothetical protein
MRRFLEHIARSRALFAIILAFAAAPVVLSQNAGEEDKIAVIKIDNVPLSLVIDNVAQQAGLNYIVDRRLEVNGNWAGNDPFINLRWENITADEALQRLLKEHKLMMVTNTATCVARLVPTGAAVKPITTSTAIDTNAPIAVLRANSEPLVDVIRKIGKEARLSVSFAAEAASILERNTISFRWQKITPRQALTALLDNYDLVLTENADTARIGLKTPSRDESSGKR